MFLIVSSKTVQVETEIKLRLPQGAAAGCTLLAAHGYGVRAPRALEVDQLYDRPDGELKTSGRVLRLRSAGGRWLLTYKGPAQEGPHKSRQEIELAVEDGAAMEKVLFALGYQRAFRYEKFRTVYAREGEPGIVTLDETPIGDFLELEGPPEWIDRTTVQLGFSQMDHVLLTYAALYAEHQKKDPCLPGDMVFRSASRTT
jgi:adenylate cyclase class 2